MPNLLRAILHIVANIGVGFQNSGVISENRINAVGEQLETYIKDAFSETLNSTTDAKTKAQAYSKIFAYQGNQTNPPDLMLTNGDAIEIKKIKKIGADLALNSSYPKSRLYSNSPMLTQACRNCEQWSERDLLYVVGVTKSTKISSLFMVYGDCYAADKEIYERVQRQIKDGVLTIQGIEFVKTKELGKLKKVDPLGITGLRIRGIWHIQNPVRVFSNYISLPLYEFSMTIVMRLEKYNSFPLADREAIEKTPNLSVNDAQISDPNNPVKQLAAKIIQYSDVGVTLP